MTGMEKREWWLRGFMASKNYCNGDTTMGLSETDRMRSVIYMGLVLPDLFVDDVLPKQEAVAALDSIEFSGGDDKVTEGKKPTKTRHP